MPLKCSTVPGCLNVYNEFLGVFFSRCVRICECRLLKLINKDVSTMDTSYANDTLNYSHRISCQKPVEQEA